MGDSVRIPEQAFMRRHPYKAFTNPCFKKIIDIFLNKHTVGSNFHLKCDELLVWLTYFALHSAKGYLC